MRQVDQVVLRIDVLSYWRQSTGAGGGDDYDLVCDRDAAGLPVLRARHLRGLLREAVRCAHSWGYFPELDPLVLFGDRNNDTDPAPGCLDCRDARMPSSVIKAVDGEPMMRDALFRRLAATAIEDDTGLAKQHSLRTMEVAVPMVLLAKLRWAPEARRTATSDQMAIEAIEKAGASWTSMLRASLPIIHAVGSRRARGLGRARMRLLEGTPS